MTKDQQYQPKAGSQVDLLDGAVWRTSSYSGTHGNCVEVASNLPGLVAIRDSKEPEGAVLVVSTEGWGEFTDGVRDGEFG